MRLHLTWRDAAATIVVAAFVVPYVGYVIRGSMPLLQDARGMGATILGLTALAILVFGRDAFGTGLFRALALAVATVALAMAGVAAFYESNDVWLIPAAAAGVVLYGLLIGHDAGLQVPTIHRSHR